MGDEEVVANAIELICRDAGSDRRLDGVERLRSDAAGDTDPGNHVRIAHE